jgi:anti-sigma regulatory factor (Ser/Thr protein kinase)
MARLVWGAVVPTGFLAVIWLAALIVAFTGALPSPRWLAALPPGHRALAEGGVAGGAALAISLIALALTTLLARRLATEVDGLATTAAGLSGSHRAAVEAAAEQAGLRGGLRQVLASLSRRHQSLVHRQLRIIDRLERQTSNSGELAELFALDHLTTRMRRHAESLAVLAGEAPGRSWNGPVSVVDVMRAAAAEVEDYKRVVVRSDAEEAVASPAVTDMIHLLSELIENATLFSPSSTKVEVRAESVANGFVIEIEDRGLGIPPGQLAEINERLADPPEIDLADADRLGLFVAGKLAARHDVGVSLTPSAYRGTKAVVVLPHSIVVDGAASGLSSDSVPGDGPVDGTVVPGPDAVGGLSGAALPGRLNLRAPGVLSLSGPRAASAPGQASAREPASAPGQASRTAPSALPSRKAASRPMVPGPAVPSLATSGPVAPGTTAPGPVAPGAAEPVLADSERRDNVKRVLPRRIRPSASGNSGAPDSPNRGDLASGRHRPLPRQAPPTSPLPEEARRLAASVQLSWRLSQEADAASGGGSTAQAAPNSDEEK